MRTYASFRVKRKSLSKKKWTPDVFVDFWWLYWCTKIVHQNGVSIQSYTKVRETFRQIKQKLWPTKTWDLDKFVCKLVFYNISFSWLLPMDGFQFISLFREFTIRMAPFLAPMTSQILTSRKEHLGIFIASNMKPCQGIFHSKSWGENDLARLGKTKRDIFFFSYLLTYKNIFTNI